MAHPAPETPAVATRAHAQNRLEFFSPRADVRQDRDLTDDDLDKLGRWTRRHRQLPGERNNPGALLELGHEPHAWLNGAGRALDRTLEVSTPPLHIEFSAPKRDSETARAFLDAPWELLAQDGRHWALACRLPGGGHRPHGHEHGDRLDEARAPPRPAVLTETRPGRRDLAGFVREIAIVR